MTQNTSTIKSIGKLGLLERLDDRTRAKGLSDYKAIVDLVRDKKYKRVEGIGDNFIPDCDLYNAVGAIYPLLNKEQRSEAVWAHLSQLDKVNCISVKLNHTSNIREPLLLTDITLADFLYWPGLTEGRQMLEHQLPWNGKKSFVDLEKEIMTEDGLFDLNKVKSDFLVAYTLMRKDITSFGEDYVKSANPEFLNRVLESIVGLKFAKAKNGEEIKFERERLYKLLPKSIHDRIEPLRQKANWIDTEQFE